MGGGGGVENRGEDMLIKLIYFKKKK